MSKIKVMTVFGTRPEAIKMAPLVLALKERADEFEAVTVVTAQHRQMLDQVLEIFKIKPDYDLDVMKQRQTLSEITSNVLMNLDKVIATEKPDIVLVHGDTTTTFAASISAFYNQTAIGHVEAGLRTWDKYSPFPEEMNRQLTDVLSDLYFAPTSQSEANLLQENHPQKAIYITGNTAIDALKQTVQSDYNHSILDVVDADKRMILVTMHRRENQGEPMKRVFKVMRQVVETHNDVEIVYPVHLNPVVQEEAPSLGKPVLVLRDTTERPEGVEAGTLKLVGTQPEQVHDAMVELLDDQAVYEAMAHAKNPYGDGQASQRILDAIAYHFGQSKEKPKAFK
ncbi:non-hydrolyzing UDP-N-acetylglucosamine 2-epimerase [Latilactobacillus curvatus]|uniref:non-hydrolyzing UDP-N-acetylglucosamine 2-epimerase n=1 Tax=Latilactobacillus curvatus TaxID=28038 RepID=UPI003C305FEA